ncbi:MAG: biotin/lipoyl-binding protein [Clostridia bacterium]|nr:biotin/lipoyl-binding protein [Clostridia bacterium]
MKKYKVIANGVEYEVLIELVSEDEEAPKTAPQHETKPQPAAAGLTRVKAPLAGTITAVNVKAGDTVKKGQVLMILEAMKMENEILAPCDGSVRSDPVQKGKQVEAGDALVDIG